MLIARFNKNKQYLPENLASPRLTTGWLLKRERQTRPTTNLFSYQLSTVATPCNVPHFGRNIRENNRATRNVDKVSPCESRKCEIRSLYSVFHRGLPGAMADPRSLVLHILTINSVQQTVEGHGYQLVSKSVSKRFRVCHSVEFASFG